METTRNKAIAKAKEEIKMALNAKRLTSFVEDKQNSGKGVQCDCGETSSVTFIGESKGKIESATVGYCKICGNH